MEHVINYRKIKYLKKNKIKATKTLILSIISSASECPKIILYF